MGNWRYICINGSLPPNVETEDVSEFVNSHIDIEYFRDCSSGVHGLEQWISNSKNGKIGITGTIGKCPSDLDFIEEEMSIIAKRYPLLDLVIDVGYSMECRRCEATFSIKNGRVTREATTRIDTMIPGRCRCDRCYKS